MKILKRISAVLLSLALVAGGFYYFQPAEIAHATAGPQIFYGSTLSSVSTGRIIPLNAVISNVSTATSSIGVLPISGTFGNLTGTVDVVPGGSTSWKIELYENTIATGYSCTITSAITTCTAAGTFSATAGNSYYIRTTVTGVPAASVMRVSAQFTPTTAGHTALFVTTTAANNGSVQTFTPFEASTNWSSTESARQNILPEGGTLENFYVSGSAAPGTGGSGKQFDYFVRDQNADTAVTCNIFEIAKDCSDITHTVSVSANDVIGIRSLPTATPTTASLGMGVDFVPTTAGDFVFMGYSSTADDASATNYYPITGNNISAVEASSTLITQAMTVTSIAINTPTAPGIAASGKSKTFTLRKNNADTSLACTITETAKTCSATGSVSFADGDTIDISDAPTNTPATSANNSYAIIANTNTGGGGGGSTDDGSSNWFMVL